MNALLLSPDASLMTSPLISVTMSEPVSFRSATRVLGVHPASAMTNDVETRLDVQIRYI